MTTSALGEPAPAGPKSRIDALDALRGVAVLGIFAINIIGFSMPWPAFANPLAFGGGGWLNHGLFTVFELFVEGSMRGLFSLMFGAGVVLFTERAAFPDGPIRIADLYYRRTLWLIVFGLVHAYVLLMPGDILLIYGLAGLVMFPFRVLSAKWLTIGAAVILLGLTASAISDELAEKAQEDEAARIAALVDAGAIVTEDEAAALQEWRDMASPPQEMLDDIIAERTGDIAAVYASNADEVSANNDIAGLVWWVIDAAMMMLLGMAFYKWRIITAERSVKFYALMLAVGYGVGLGLRVWMISSRWAADFSPELWIEWIPAQLARVAVTIGHVGAFFLLWKAASASLPMRALTAAGRMALTNYISQTIIANFIFSGVGLGLYGSLDRAAVCGVMVVIWLAQLAFSLWWLARFRFGPLEWGWRSLTYWRRQPIRLI